MQTTAISNPTQQDWRAVARDLAETFGKRAADYDEQDAFVRENYDDLRAAGLIAAAVPAELGGGGASYEEIADVLRILAHGCGSTALAFSMHQHQVAIPVFKWHNGAQEVEPLLRRVAAEQIIFVSSGGSDWLDAAGTAERVDGGFRITARKGFSSGSPVGNLLMTSAVYADPEAESTVLHFGVPLSAPEVTIRPTWRAMGMRATGSHDIIIEGFFVPDAAIAAKRPQGKWHPLFHLVAKRALPLIYSAYFGIAEAARDLAVDAAQKRRLDPTVHDQVGRMENELLTARLAWQAMVEAGVTLPPGPETSSRVAQLRTILAQSAIRTVEQALEVAGGASYLRLGGLERRFRDIQAARFHPLREPEQYALAGRMALGLGPDKLTA